MDKYFQPPYNNIYILATHILVIRTEYDTNYKEIRIYFSSE